MMPHHWILFVLLLDARDLHVREVKPVASYYEVAECLKAQSGRISKVKGGAIEMYVCSHPKVDKEA